MILHDLPTLPPSVSVVVGSMARPVNSPGSRARAVPEQEEPEGKAECETRCVRALTDVDSIYTRCR